MKILFDQGTPAPLRHLLVDHSVRTAYEMGWADLDNGQLLNAAEAAFDALITTDQNLRYQQSVHRQTAGDPCPAYYQLAEDSAEWGGGHRGCERAQRGDFAQLRFE